MNEFNFDNEIEILKFANTFESKECLIISDKENSDNYWQTAKIINTLVSERCFEVWEDNTKSNAPPDFINKTDLLMMEIMRIDDHSSNGKKNPYRSEERKMRDDWKKIKSCYQNLSQNCNVYFDVQTDLPTEKDHNYKNYYTSFQRAIRKHLAKVSTYKSNHPNMKLIFFVMDETSGIYFERHLLNAGRIHRVFADNRFVNEFLNSKLDYLILFTPYNHFQAAGSIQKLPHLIIYDIANMKKNKEIKFTDYDEMKMISSEK